MKSCDEHSNADAGSAVSTRMAKRYPPRLSLRSSYEMVPGLLSSIVDPYPVPVIDYPQEKKENVLCTSKLTLFHEYSPFMNSYNIYHMKETSLPVQETLAPPVIRQPAYRVQRTFSRSSSKYKSSDGEDDAEEITCDVIKKHWCYYIMCFGLCFD
ncbi:hypothetical protein KP79_PYT19300 [Mizuhopecten yessoensis]|uniref:Uncharacterized protein n=1 Tax=Mizuhopecten yessoensis TaxID=6573 RepID=A0A210Q9Q0_MIZYE|nr:hypothetical protein KP79_PYT19300 [Mizuhopecten yessoensis]